MNSICCISISFVLFVFQFLFSTKIHLFINIDSIWFDTKLRVWNGAICMCTRHIVLVTGWSYCAHTLMSKKKSYQVHNIYHVFVVLNSSFQFTRIGLLFQLSHSCSTSSRPPPPPSIHDISLSQYPYMWMCMCVHIDAIWHWKSSFRWEQVMHFLRWASRFYFCKYHIDEWII